MVQKFSTKNEKHAQDNEKRKESLKKKLDEKRRQKELIKNALSSSATVKSKKIVFDEESSGGSDNEEGKRLSQKKGDGKISLFDDSDDEIEENYEIQVKRQFEGKKGRKLLELQSNYNNDERFKLDERFYDDDEDEREDGSSDDDVKHNSYTEYSQEGMDGENEADLDGDMKEEKVQQLKVLESVLGQPIKTAEKAEKKSKRSFFEMVRYDASNEDHKRHDNQEASKKEEPPVKKKKVKLDKEERKKLKEARKKELENEEKESPSSGAKFYEVTNDLKAALKNRTEEEGKFSLLAAFSKKGPEDEDGEMDEFESEEEEGDDHEEFQLEDDASVGDDVEDTKQEESVVQKNEKDVMVAQGISKEKFFFTDDDPRVEEGLVFMNMKDSEEAKKAIENYDQTRRDIREVLRLRWQKHRQRNNPFKKKIGGASRRNVSFTTNRKKLGKPNVRSKR